ncbi:hypothetical protein, partial [Sulfitobacter sp.]|uniref:hypothetical protein n=1 Tax=Sulfitobacter sp. TaxID=1903071 RepID=UPI003F6AA2C1
MRLAICNSITAIRNALGGIEQIITATTAPAMGALTHTDTPADGLPASATQTGNYASTAGTIVSAVASYAVNGTSQTGAYDLDYEDIVTASVLVTDSEGNTRTFNAGSSTVPLPLPSFTTQPSISGTLTVGETLTFNEGVAGPNATLTIETLTLGGVDKSGELSGNTWDTTGENAGTISYQVRAANNTGSALSNVITETLSAVPVVSDIAFGALTPAGAGGIPVAGTSITSGDTNGHFEIVAGHLVPTAAGEGNLSGTYALTLNNGDTLDLTIEADKASARPQEIATVYNALPL